MPTWSLVLDPRDGDLYVGNDEGVFVSTNEGSTWTTMGVGMPKVSVQTLELNQNTNTLTVGTYGRSVLPSSLSTAR